MRTRLCIVPLCHSSRMPASTSGMPVRPRCHAARSSALGWLHGNWSKAGRKFSVARFGQWNRMCQPNSRQPTSLRNFSEFAWRPTAACQTWNGLSSPNRRRGLSRLVAGTAGSSRRW